MYNKPTSLPWLRDYEHALQFEAKVKPIRGKEDKPLGTRADYKIRSIRKKPNGDIACRLYSTDVVTYRPDGVIAIKLDTYTTQSTSQFIEAITNYYCGIFDRKMWLKYSRSDRLYTMLDPTEDNLFVREGENLKPLTLRHPVKHTLRRKQANNVRRRVQPFIDHLVLMDKLREDGIYTKEEMQMASIDIWRRWSGNDDLFMQLITPQEGVDKTEDYYKATLLLAAKYGKRLYYRDTCYMPLDVALSKLDMFLFKRFKNDDLFTRHEVNVGLVRDPWREVFL